MFGQQEASRVIEPCVLSQPVRKFEPVPDSWLKLGEDLVQAYACGGYAGNEFGLGYVASRRGASCFLADLDRGTRFG